MDPDHDSLTPSRAPKTQRLPPQLALVAANTLDLLALLLLATLDVLEVAGNPLLLAALVHKLDAVLPERGHGEQREIAVLGDQLRRPRYDHRRDGLVALQEFFYLLRRDGDQVRLDELGVLDDGAGVDDRGEGLCGEVSSAEDSVVSPVLLNGSRQIYRQEGVRTSVSAAAWPACS